MCGSRGGREGVSFCDTIYHKVHTVEFRQFNELMTRLSVMCGSIGGGGGGRVSVSVIQFIIKCIQ